MCKICQTKHWSRDGHALAPAKGLLTPSTIRRATRDMQETAAALTKPLTAKKPKRKVGR